jgi:hypothetical protein
MKIRKITAMIASVLLAGLLSVAYADDPNPPFWYNGTSYPTVNVMTNGQLMQFDTPAVLINNRTMVPLRYVSETLGSVVTWDQASHSVYILLATPIALPTIPLPSMVPQVNNGTFQGFPIVNVFVNGTKVEGDTPAILFNNRTMVPIRFVSEALGCKVSWDAATYTAIINKPVVGNLPALGINNLPLTSQVLSTLSNGLVPLTNAITNGSDTISGQVENQLEGTTPGSGSSGSNPLGGLSGGLGGLSSLGGALSGGLPGLPSGLPSGLPGLPLGN